MTFEQNSRKNGQTQSDLRLSAEMKQKIWEEIEEARAVDYLYYQNECRDWERAQLAKAPKIVALLRKYIPSGPLQEVEEFLSNRYGCDCVRAILDPDSAR